MRIACLGGGPAGLYFAISMKLRDSAHEVTVIERNRPDDADFLGAGAVKFNNFNRHWLVRGMQDGSFHFNVL